MAFHEDQTSLLLFVPGNVLEPSQETFEPLGERDAAVWPQVAVGGCRTGAVLSLRGGRRISTAGDRLGGKSWRVSSLPVCLSSGKSRFSRANWHRRSHLPN